MDDSLHARFTKRFESEWGLFQAIDNSHLIAIATFGVASNGVASVDEMLVMLVNENWIPLESMYEKELLDKLTEQNRSFLKALRYNLASDRPLASMVLLDTKPNPVAMYIIPPSFADNDRYQKGLDELIQASSLGEWIWRPGQSDMPAFPRITEAVSTARPQTAPGQVTQTPTPPPALTLHPAVPRNAAEESPFEGPAVPETQPAPVSGTGLDASDQQVARVSSWKDLPPESPDNLDKIPV
jgi:hypothetical protein